MDHLLVVPQKDGVPETSLESLSQSGWRVTVSSDVVRAKQMLQRGDVAGIMVEFGDAETDAERFKVLRYVHEFCPGTVVIMLNAGTDAFKTAGTRLVQALNTMDDARMEPASSVLDLFNLSPAQKRIAELVAQAYPNREIARRLRIKEQSVRNELSRIFKKMGVWNRVELALLMRNVNNTPQAEVTAAIPGQAWPAQFKPPVPATDLLPPTTV